MYEIGPSILWSPLPMELVVEGLSSGGTVEPRMEMSVGGRLLQVVDLKNGTGRVERLISGNSQDYLDPRWQPGSVVSLRQ